MDAIEEVEWIVCLGRTRTVTDGRVACPKLGRTSVTVCEACHELMTSSIERGDAMSCEVDVPYVRME